MKFADFVIPESLAEARSVLKKLGDTAFPVAGATAFQYLSDRPGITAVDISRLGLSGIQSQNGSFRIGATTTLTDLVRHRANGWVLNRVATLIPTHQVRNISTVGGNIARLFPWSELPLALLTLEATIVIQGDQERAVSAEEFFASPPSRMLKSGDLISAVLVPALPPHTGFGYKKENVTNSAFGLMTAAAVIHLQGDTLARVRVAAGSGVPTPRRLPAVEKALEGKPAEPALFKAAVEQGIREVTWKGREGMSDEFGRHLAAVITEDALNLAWQEARGK